MKKYLMTGIAALVLCAGMTSCSHDDGEEWSQAKEDLAKYNMAFMAYVGGKIAPEQTWGFSDNSAARMTRGLADYVGYKGSLMPKVNGEDYIFPSDCAASNFMADVPEGVLSFTEVAGPYQTGYASGVSYLDASWTQSINIWGLWDGTALIGGQLYVVGNNDFSYRDFGVCQNLDIYLLEGATLTLNDGAASTMKANIYIAPGAKLVVNGTVGLLKLDNGAKVYNHGEIIAKSFEANNNSMLYNVGTLTTDGQVLVANNESVIVNDGTITSGTSSSKTGSLVLAGSGRVQNNAEWTIYGSTIVNSNDNIWVNNGHFITDYFTYTATSSSVINNCLLTVNEDFNMNVSDGSGSFKIDAGGGVETKNFNGGGPFTATENYQQVTFNGGPFRIEMGSRSVFKVTGTARLNALSSGTGYGFHGVGQDYAVFQANSIVKDGDGHYNVTYGGNLYVSAESHFEQGYSGSYPYIVYEGSCSEENIYAPGFKSGNPSIRIPATACNPGFGNDTPDVEYDLRIIAEDLSASGDTDFDFNDVVFDLKYDNANATICLLAAGGTLPLRIDGKDVFEVHKLFDVDTDYMVNTNAAALKLKGNSGRDIEPVVFQLGRGIRNATEANGIKLEVFKNGEWQEMRAPKGEPASKLAVGTTYGWLNERTSIKAEYPTFVEWANGTNFTSKWW